jgi:hypothetical protein
MLRAPNVFFQADARVRTNRIGSARGLYRTFLTIEESIAGGTMQRLRRVDDGP